MKEKLAAASVKISTLTALGQQVEVLKKCCHASVLACHPSAAIVKTVFLLQYFVHARSEGRLSTSRRSFSAAVFPD